MGTPCRRVPGGEDTPVDRAAPGALWPLDGARHPPFAPGCPRRAGSGGGSGASKDARRQLPHSAQGRVEGQGGPPRPACLGHPWMLTPGRRGGHWDTFSLQLVCTILQLWAAHRAPRFTCEGAVPCILGETPIALTPICLKALV